MCGSAITRLAAATVGLLFGSGGILFAAQTPTIEVFSREYSFNAGGAKNQQVFSREYSFNAGAVQLREVFSREVSFNAGGVLNQEVFSREYSFEAPPIGPDLVVVPGATTAPTTGYVNQTFTVHWRVRNQGVLSRPSTATWLDRISFSQGMRLASGGPAQLSYDVTGPNSLVPTAYYDRSQTFLMPASATTFTITISTDAAATLTESYENNNVFVLPQVTVFPAPRPNLQSLVSSGPTGTITAGSVVPISFGVRNVGDAPTDVPSWSDAIYIGAGLPPSSPNPGSIQLTHLRSFINPTFLLNDPAGTAPYSNYARSEVVTLRADLAPGTYFLAARTDAQEAVAEVDELDNYAYSQPFLVQEPNRPNLDIQALSLRGGSPGVSAVPCTAGSPGTLLSTGTTAQLEWSVFNVGLSNLTAGSSRTEIWISSNGATTTLPGGEDALAPASNLRLADFADAHGPLPVAAFSVRLRQVFLPPSLTQTLPSPCNDYYFKVRTNSDSSIAETETTGAAPYFNDIEVVGPFRILTGFTPDLTPTQIGLIPGHPAPRVGQSLIFTWNVQNAQGPGWSAPLTWHDRVWLSQNTQIEPALDHLLGTFQQSSVLSGSAWTIPSYSRTASFTLAPTLVPAIQTGNYFLIVETDVGNAVYEASGGGESNNQLHPSLQTNIPMLRDPADLSIADTLPIAPAQGDPGASINLSWSVRNLPGSGLTTTASWIDRVYLSDSPTVLTNPRLLLEEPHTGVLGPGAAYSTARTVALPFAPPGARFLHFKTDVGGVVFEEPGALANNTAVLPFLITNGIADLVVDQVTATTDGIRVSANWTVRNAGSAATGASSWSDRVYLANGPNLGLASQQIPMGHWLRSEPLAPGASYATGATLAIPNTTTPGNWYVIVEADGMQQVVEVLDQNNDRGTAVELVLQPAPPGGGGGGGGPAPAGQGWVPSNLVTHDVQVPTSAVTAGQLAALSWKVTNQGPGPTSVNTWSDHVFLSQDTVLDGQDLYIGFYTHTTLLAAGETRAVTRRLEVPLFVSGPRVVIVKGDAHGAVHQAGQVADDTAFSLDLLSVQTPPPRDLRISSSVVSPNRVMGEALDLQWTTHNDALAEVPAPWNWSDGFWLLPANLTFPTSAARFLGHIASTASAIPAQGETTQYVTPASRALVVPGVPPGDYKVAILVDSLGRIAESEETDNLHYTSVIQVQAIGVQVPGTATADVPAGDSRWFEFVPDANKTLEVEFEHDDPDAVCELFIRADSPPELGTYDFAALASATGDAHLQRLRIPRTSGARYFAMARTISNTSAQTSGVLRIADRPFEITRVVPDTVGAGIVTLRLEGSLLWRAYLPGLGNTIQLRDATGAIVSQEVALAPDGTLLARFDLRGVPSGTRQIAASDVGGAGLASWSAGVITIEPPAPLALEAEMVLQRSVRRGEKGPGVLIVRNIGNVDVPFSAAIVGHGHDTASSADERVDLIDLDPELEPNLVSADSTGLLFFVEDLGPGQEHRLEFEMDVGDLHPAQTAAIGFGVRPLDQADFVAGPLSSIARALRLIAAADGATPNVFSAAVHSADQWDALVAAAFAAGQIAYDRSTLHLDDAPAWDVPSLARALGRGIALQLGAPPGVQLPESVIGAVAHSGSCAMASDVALDCEALFPTVCSNGQSTSSITVIRGLNVPVGAACLGTPIPIDPDEKSSHPGLGPSRTVSAQQPLRYQVQFENQSSATAWASRIIIQDEIADVLQAASVRFDEVRIGGTRVVFPPNTSSYAGQVEHRVDDDTVVTCQISALTDASTGTVVVLLQALDPETGMPTSLGDVGLLPPSRAGFEEQASGHLALTLLAAVPSPSPGLGTLSRSGLIGTNSASLQFNAEAPIRTNTVQNLLDDRGPTSLLQLDSIQGTQVTLSWSATDVEALPSGLFPGTGVRAYNLFVGETSQGPWTPLLTQSSATRFVYTGVFGASPAFKVEAIDRVGNLERKQTADLTVGIPTDCNNNGIPDDSEIATGALTDVNLNGQADICECLVQNVCVSTPDPATGLAPVMSASGVPSISHAGFFVHVDGAPAEAKGTFVVGSAQQQVPLGLGFSCATGSLLRVGVIGADLQGSAVLRYDFGPLNGGTLGAQPGETRYFQYIFPIPSGPSAGTFDASDALRVTFCP